MTKIIESINPKRKSIRPKIEPLNPCVIAGIKYILILYVTGNFRDTLSKDDIEEIHNRIPVEFRIGKKLIRHILRLKHGDDIPFNSRETSYFGLLHALPILGMFKRYKDFQKIWMRDEDVEKFNEDRRSYLSKYDNNQQKEITQSGKRIAREFLDKINSEISNNNERA